MSELEFQVFLSHNSKDKAVVREVAKALRERGITVWLDEDELRPGVPWQQLLEHGIRGSGSVAVLVGNDGVGPWEDEEMQGALRLAVQEKRPVIPVLLPEAPGEPKLPLFVGNRTWVDLRQGLGGEGLEKLIWGITGQKRESVETVDHPPSKTGLHTRTSATRRRWFWAAVGVTAALLVLAPLRPWSRKAPWPWPGMDWVKIEPGVFFMGDEKRRVTIGAGFWMGKYELTQGQYAVVMGTNPSKFKGSTNLPVDSVSWVDATNFCAALTSHERQAGRIPANWAYRLPTAAEWEYAYRAGTRARLSFGADPQYAEPEVYGWYKSNSSTETHVVGARAPNAWGLYDMQGNVWEWCQDWYTAVGASWGSGRVLRGGSWYDSARDCRLVSQCAEPPLRWDDRFGFRVILAPRSGVLDP